MWIGIGYALIAGMIWGLVFISPLLLPDYPPALQSVGRYLAFGGVALLLGWLDRANLRQLQRADWIEALKLSAVGNLLYYSCLAAAIQRAGGPLPTLIMGTLPVVIAVCANLGGTRISWARMTPSLLLILLGILCVNQIELSHLLQQGTGELGRYLSGIVLALAALVCWTWYPLRNAAWLRQHPTHSPSTWATAQGLTTLPLALLGYTALTTLGHSQSTFDFPFGPTPALFIGLMLMMGLMASWLGTLCWNQASRRLPTTLAGQLIVFETLAGLTYHFILRRQWPAPFTFLGMVLLLVGVIWAVRLQSANRAKAAAASH